MPSLCPVSIRFSKLSLLMCPRNFTYLVLLVSIIFLLPIFLEAASYSLPKIISKGWHFVGKEAAHSINKQQKKEKKEQKVVASWLFYDRNGNQFLFQTCNFDRRRITPPTSLFKKINLISVLFYWFLNQSWSWSKLMQMWKTC